MGAFYHKLSVQTRGIGGDLSESRLTRLRLVSILQSIIYPSIEPIPIEGDIVSNRQKKDILVRLRRVEGQIRGIQRMIEEERECEAIVTQLMAARSALDRAGLFIMTHHIERCLSSSEGGADRDQLERIISFFLKFGVAPESEAQEGDVDVSEP